MAHRHDRRLGVQRIKHRLDKHEIRAPLDQRPHLLGIDIDEEIPIDLAKTRIIHIGAERERLVGRPNRAGHETRPDNTFFGVTCGIFIGHPAGEPGRGEVDLAHQMFRAIIGLANAVGREGVGLGNVRPRLEIGAVDRFGHLGLGQREDVVIALLVAPQPQRSGIIGLGQLVILDLGAKGAIGDQDALGGLGEQRLAGG